MSNIPSSVWRAYGVERVCEYVAKRDGWFEIEGNLLVALYDVPHDQAEEYAWDMHAILDEMSGGDTEKILDILNDIADLLDEVTEEDDDN